MIPHRIMLEGFLSYGQRQEIDLSDLGLCMLSGPNGSGKSSVFDAIPFALFGEHRRGKRDHQEVIHKGCDGAAVEFEFHLDGLLWKIRRTLRRPTGKSRSADHRVQLSRWHAKPPGILRRRLPRRLQIRPRKWRNTGGAGECVNTQDATPAPKSNEMQRWNEVWQTLLNESN